MILQKGSAYTAEYSSTDYPVLDENWVGSISLFLLYPGTASFTKVLVRNANVMQLLLTNVEILNFADGVYTLESTISNPAVGVTITSVGYANVLPVNVSDSPMCKIFGTIIKSDGTPTGSPISTLVNTVSGAVLQSGWKGADVKASIPDADADAGKVVGVETITTQTNAAGYFELYVIQGLTVTVTCPAFGKSVVVDTTGLDTIDISTFF